MSYLEEAAALLRKSAEANEESNGKGRYASPTALRDGRERIAMKFAQLGAIERGLLPPEMLAALIAEYADRKP
jgi:hypothetical protein